MSRSPQKSRDRLVWIDCEMTGLNPANDVILEIATIITSYDLQVVAVGPVLAIRHKESTLRRMDHWNRRTHTRSGLLRRVREESVSLAEAERRTLHFIRRYCYAAIAPLCGNSIGQDKRFLVKYMPLLHGFLNYRVVDVSSIKLLVSRWYTRAYEAPVKKDSHSALSDIEESIAELAHYRDTVFVKPPRKRKRHSSR